MYFFIITAALLAAALACDNVFALTVTKKSVTLNNLPCKDVKLVVLSDLHTRRFGKGNTRLIRKTAALQPDFICLCGDMVSRNTAKFDDLRSLLCGLGKICPVYYSLGNHELSLKKYSELAAVIKNAGNVTLLDNSVETVDGIRFAGISLKRQNYRVDGGYSDLEPYTADDLDDVLGAKTGFTLLLAHNPLFFDAYSKWGAELTLCGHIHGGVITLPLVGGLLSPERKLFPKYYAGLYEKDGSAMAVSRGLGKLRLFNPPEILLLNIRKRAD